MTFIEKFEEVKKICTVDAKFGRDFAIQIKLTDEDCGGIFYVENRDGGFNVEPYDYRDRDGEIVCESKLLESVLQGKKSFEAARKSGLEINGNEDAVRELVKIAEIHKLEREAEKQRKAEEKAKKDAEKAEKEAEKAKKAEEKAKKDAEKAKKAEEKAKKEAEKAPKEEKKAEKKETVKPEEKKEEAALEKSVKKTGNSKKARKAKKAAKREAKQLKMNI